MSNRRRNVDKSWEVAQALKCFEQHQESDARRGPLRLDVGQGEFVETRRVDGGEFLGSRLRLQTRVSGLIDAGHLSRPPSVNQPEAGKRLFYYLPA